MNLDYPEQCLLCLDTVVQHTENPTLPSGLHRNKISCEVQNFQQLCQYLRIDFPLQSLKFKNVSRILTDESKYSCESLLCMDCLEIVDKLGWMYGDLRKIQRKIDVGIQSIQNVIKKSDEDDSNNTTTDSGNGQQLTKRRKISEAVLSSSIGKDYWEFVETFRKLVKEVVIQEPKPLVVSAETKALADRYEKMIEGADDEEDKDTTGPSGPLPLVGDDSMDTLNNGDNADDDNLVNILSNVDATMDTNTTTPTTDMIVYMGNSMEIAIMKEDEKVEEEAIEFEIAATKVGNDSTASRQTGKKSFSKPACSLPSFALPYPPKGKMTFPTLQKSKATCYTCRYCEEIFESVIAYYIHRKKNHPKESKALIFPTAQRSNFDPLGNEKQSTYFSFQVCPICGEQKGHNKNSILQFMEHMLSHEVFANPVITVPGDISLPDKDKPFCCNHCDQRFLLEMNLDLHKICYHESTLIKLKCHECGDTSSKSWEDLMAHLVDQHGSVNIYCCKSCSMAFTSADKMLEHMQVHVLSKRLPCSECESVAPTLKNLYQHFNEVHPNLLSRLQCDICKEAFLMPSTFKRHLTLCHPPFVTTTGNNQVFSPKFGNTGNDGTVTIETTSQHVQCPHCLEVRIFKNKTTLENHIRIHHDITVQKHKCEQCSKEFVHRSTLRYHIQQVHLGIRYGCPHCSKSFTAKSLLKGHLKLHRGAGPALLTCSICNKKFASLSALKTHKISQHEHNEPASCDICGKEFLNTFSLRAHKSELHNFKQFACPQCPLSFSRLRQFEKHKSTHEGEMDINGTQQVEHLPIKIVAFGTSIN